MSVAKNVPKWDNTGAPEVFWWGVLRIYEGLQEARKSVEAANRCADPAYALYYRDAIINLVRLEAQLDGICVACDITRDKLKEWVDHRLEQLKEWEE